MFIKFFNCNGDLLQQNFRPHMVLFQENICFEGEIGLISIHWSIQVQLIPTSFTWESAKVIPGRQVVPIPEASTRKEQIPPAWVTYHVCTATLMLSNPNFLVDTTTEKEDIFEC